MQAISVKTLTGKKVFGDQANALWPCTVFPLAPGLTKQNVLARAKILPIREQMQEFDGRLPHQTQPFVLREHVNGHRWVVVAHRIDGWQSMSSGVRLQLMCNGLNWLEMVNKSPLRAMLVYKATFAKDDVVKHIKEHLLRGAQRKTSTGGTKARAYVRRRALAQVFRRLG